MWARQTCSCRPCAERKRERQKKNPLTCPVIVVCQSRQVQSRDIVTRLCATKSLLDLHGRRLAEKRAKHKHQLHQSGGSALLKLSNTLACAGPCLLTGWEEAGGGAAGTNPYLLIGCLPCSNPTHLPFRVGVANFMFFSISIHPSLSLCVPERERERAEHAKHAGRLQAEMLSPISHFSISETLPSLLILNNHTGGVVWVQTDVIQINVQQTHTSGSGGRGTGSIFGAEGGLFLTTYPH